MKKNSEYKKKKAIKRYLDGEKVKQIAGTMKISTSTIYSWIRQYNEKRNSIVNEVTELRKLAERQQKMIEQRYLYLSQKQEENSLLQSSYALPARTIDPAQADPRPVSPRLSRIAMSVLFFGLAIPFLLLALICFLRDPEFRAWRDLEISR